MIITSYFTFELCAERWLGYFLALMTSYNLHAQYTFSLAVICLQLFCNQITLGLVMTPTS